MAATRKDRGNSCHRGQATHRWMMTALRSWAKLVKATFSSWACSWGPGCFVVCWLVDSLYPPPNCGLERTSRIQRWHRPSKDLFRGMVSGVWRFFFFFFFLLEHHRRISRWTAGCAVLKSAPSGRGADRRHARALSVSFERPLSPSWTSPQLTSLKCVSWVFKSLSRTVRMPQQSRCWHERRHPFLVQRICLHSDTHRQSHWKGSYDHTAESFSQSPMLSATRSPKQASEGAQNQTPE